MIVDVSNTEWAKFLNRVWPVMRDELANYVAKQGAVNKLRIYNNQLVDKETSNYFIRTHGFMSSIPGLVNLDIMSQYESNPTNFEGFLQGYVSLRDGSVRAATSDCPSCADAVVAFSCHIDPRQPKTVPTTL
jgi:hypothetical protein